VGGAWQEFEAESRDSSRRLLVLAAVIAVAALVALQYFGGDDGNQRAATVAEPARLQAEPAPRIQIESVTETESPSGNAPRTERSGNQTYVGVYECMVNGQRVVSDHPCGADAEARTLVVDQADPRDVARQQQRTWAAQAGSPPQVEPPARSSVRSQVVTETLPNQAACDAIDQAIANLNSRMRAGYTSAQGEWLRAEWHDLQKQREELDCGRR